MSDKKALGALWIKSSGDGLKKYMSGKLEIDEKVVDIVVFKNSYKNRDNQPDYKIYESEKREKTPIKESQKKIQEDLDIPF